MWTQIRLPQQEHCLIWVYKVLKTLLKHDKSRQLLLIGTLRVNGHELLSAQFKEDNSNRKHGRATIAFLHVTHHLDLKYMPTKYHQNISKGPTSFSLRMDRDQIDRYIFPEPSWCGWIKSWYPIINWVSHDLL